jgi:hypothetical protein
MAMKPDRKETPTELQINFIVPPFPNEWEYKAEGAENIIVSYVGCEKHPYLVSIFTCTLGVIFILRKVGKILRLKKLIKQKTLNLQSSAQDWGIYSESIGSSYLPLGVSQFIL